MNVNKVIIAGRLTRDIEVTMMPNQTPVGEFGLATNRQWTSSSGEKKEEVTFVDCTAYGKVCEIIAKYKKKGDELFVIGRLKLDTWTTPDGNKRSKMRVVVEEFQFVGSGAGGKNQAPKPQTQPAQAQGTSGDEPEAPIADSEIPF